MPNFDKIKNEEEIFGVGGFEEEEEQDDDDSGEEEEDDDEELAASASASAAAAAAAGSSKNEELESNIEEKLLFPSYYSSLYYAQVSQLAFKPLPSAGTIQNFFNEFGPVHKFKASSSTSAIIRYDVMDYAKLAKSKAHGAVIPGTHLRLFVTYGQVSKKSGERHLPPKI